MIGRPPPRLVGAFGVRRVSSEFILLLNPGELVASNTDFNDHVRPELEFPRKYDL
jgi:hypothetical protein